MEKIPIGKLMGEYRFRHADCRMQSSHPPNLNSSKLLIFSVGELMEADLTAIRRKVKFHIKLAAIMLLHSYLNSQYGQDVFPGG